jgi:hypothetical protein
MVAINMEMPKNCAECQFGCITYNNNRKCKISESCYTVIFTSKERPTDCPLKEIITCKDCKSNENNTCCIDGFGVADDYYCASAKRKE